MKRTKTIAMEDRSIVFRIHLCLALMASAFVVLTVSLSALALHPLSL